TYGARAHLRAPAIGGAGRGVAKLARRCWRTPIYLRGLPRLYCKPTPAGDWSDAARVAVRAGARFTDSRSVICTNRPASSCVNEHRANQLGGPAFGRRGAFLP